MRDEFLSDDPGCIATEHHMTLLMTRIASQFSGRFTPDQLAESLDWPLDLVIEVLATCVADEMIAPPAECGDCGGWIFFHPLNTEE